MELISLMNYNELRKPITPKKKEVFINLTLKFLLPQINLMGEDLVEQMDYTDWLAFGLCDRKYPKYNEFDNKLFCLASTEKNMQYWLDHKEHYLYQDGTTNKVMVILELPINNRDAFLEGRYSQLYDLDVAKEIIGEYHYRNNIQYPNTNYSIIAKKEHQRELFQEKRNKDFGVNFEVDKNQEYEYPPNLTREIFNYVVSDNNTDSSEGGVLDDNSHKSS